jgi:hypothetical protein
MIMPVSGAHLVGLVATIDLAHLRTIDKPVFNHTHSPESLASAEPEHDRPTGAAASRSSASLTKGAASSTRRPASCSDIDTTIRK